MFIFSAITPHSPILIPTLGQEAQKKLKRTLQSLKFLEEQLYVAKPDTVIFISPHGKLDFNNFFINFAPVYEVNFERFGDLVTRFNLLPDTITIEHIRHFLREEKNLNVHLFNEKVLDYGVGVPAFFLMTHQMQTKIVPLYTSNVSIEEHFEFGKQLQEEFLRSKKRLAIIASANLSHNLHDEKDPGLALMSKKMDESIVRIFRNKKFVPQKLFDLEQKFPGVQICGLKPIALLMGLLDGLNFSRKILSYEGPLGIGYLTMNFLLK